MIIDCHGHYTTSPASHQAWREEQLAAFASGLTHDLSLHELARRRLVLEDAVHAHPWLSLAAYVGVYTLVVALSLPAALVMTLTGGLLFGAWIGGGAAALSCTMGSAIIFLVCRTAAGDFIRERAGPTAARLEAGLRRDAFSYIVTLRLLPIAPFWLINLALGLIDIPLGVYVAASLVGILPVSVVYASLGSGLGRLLTRGGRPDLHDVLRPSVILALAGLVVLSLLPIAVRAIRRRRS